jgi:hypothetical protein
MEFVRFPRTPHLAWLGDGQPRDDKVMSTTEARELLQHPVVVEEKLDGANLGISVDADGEVRVQNRGSYLAMESLHPQFRPLRQWLGHHRLRLIDALTPDLILFGEWCYATHSIHYTHLPDWFVGFDVYDRGLGKFWSVDRRDPLMAAVGLTVVPQLAHGRLDMDDLLRLLGRSHFTEGLAEGLYVRRDHEGHLEQRAKLVRAEFTQTIGEHWSRATIRPNSRVLPHHRQ